MNRAILIGRLGRDPEVRYTGAGQAVANFSLATEESYKDRRGERQKRTEWHKVVVWGKQAENVEKFLEKGSLVAVEGKLQTRTWDGKGGEKRSAVEIVASYFRILEGGKNAVDGKTNGKAEQEEYTATDEDIPF